MTDQQTAPVTRLWTREGFREDEWSHAESAAALAGNGCFILPSEVLLELDPAERRLVRERLGVLLQPGDQIEPVVDLLGEIALVALAFPAFSDGRSFSKAQLLRSRHGFSGALRATGQVLVDQLPHMLRVGFDEFEIADPVLLKRLEEKRLDGLPLFYQPAAVPGAKAGGYSWRHVAAD
ncbi:hypothetical protein ATER59S_03182 [Aquamicrobium terrae]